MDIKALFTSFSEACFLPSMVLSRPVSIFNLEIIDKSSIEEIEEQE